MKNTAYVAVGAALLLSGCAGPSVQEQASQLVLLTPEHFRDTATLKDDPLDTTAIITTEPGWKETKGLLKVVWNDEFLRVFVDKRTGAATFQVYTYVAYFAPGWHFYQTANYATPSGPTEVPVDVIDRHVIDCDAQAGGCDYSESVGFDVTEPFLKAIAATYSPGAGNPWLFKLNAKSGDEYKDGLMPAEIAGCLMAVDAYRASHKLPVK